MMQAPSIEVEPAEKSRREIKCYESYSLERFFIGSILSLYGERI
jgi:hypothetical protein